MMKGASRFLKEKVRAIEVESGKSISSLLRDMARTGFQGRRLAECVETIERMIQDENTAVLMGYAGSLSTTGQWKIINWFIENRYIDVLVPTGANISEDIVEAMGYSYWQGTPEEDDRELFKCGINRYYDVYGKCSDYQEMTDLIVDFIMTLGDDARYSSMEFLHLFGKYLLKKKIKSIVATAAENMVPIFCPAIMDSAYGDAVLIAKSKGFNFVLDAVKEHIQFMSIAEKVKSTGVIYIGGGVPKDIIQLLAVSSSSLYKEKKIPNRSGGKMREGAPESSYPHKYAVQITTDSPQWGGLSGCTFDEAVSWGKEDPEGRYVQCYCDATIALPIISHALSERIGKKRKGADLSYLFRF